MNQTSLEQPTLFSTDATGLPPCAPSPIVVLEDGDSFDLRLTPVANVVGEHRVRMLAYNGSIPGPTLRVRQGSKVTVRVANDADCETTIHWHGLRLENRYDGVPDDTQSPIPVGGSFTYRLQFPDEGLYWYHPHVREDYGIEMGLYGNIVVDPAAGAELAPVNREAFVTLDDVLIEDGTIRPFRVQGVTHTAMGRFGNVMLTGGEADLQLQAGAGEIVRLFLTNTANTRIFNVAVPHARMKLVGGDSGCYEHEQWVDAVLLAPAERAIVDVYFDRPGSFPLAHLAPDRSYRLGTVTVADAPPDESFVEQFETLHQNAALADERDRLDTERLRSPDKTLVFAAEMHMFDDTADTTVTTWVCPMHPEVVRDEPGSCPRCGMKLIPGDAGAAPHGDHGHHHDHGSDAGDGLEWEDLMPEINAQSDESNFLWKLIDADTGAENHEIDWAFTVGDRVKLRLVNTMDSDHPMHHPFHVHGAGRFLVIDRDGEPEQNLVWKDTVLLRAGQTVDVLLDVTNPGLWMAHCHIAEHHQDGMMLRFRVAQP